MTDVAAPGPFRLDDVLPGAVTLLEASAGTGKTSTIAALAVRYLAEGLAIDRLLVMTFTRSATGELRSRVRARLVSAEAGLRSTLAGRPPVDDELVALLGSGPREAVVARQRALGDALADFDAATIATIHGFCEQVLGGLGTAADYSPDLRFVDDDDASLIDEVVDDLYLRKFRDAEEPPQFTRREARDIVGVCVANREARIEPSDAGAETTGALRARLAGRGRDEVLTRARWAGIIGYDDQLGRLQSSLSGPSGSTAIRRLRERFAVVLVDEFQDTDPVQWEILRLAFAASGSPLLLIGDPKQAIYSFRGADVLAYLRAAGTARQRFTLGTNWRSDQPLLDALDSAFVGATLGHPDIPYRRVTASPDHLASGLRDAPAPAALRLRLVHRGDRRVDVTKPGWAQADSARAVVAADLADDMVTLLSSGASLSATDCGSRPVAPGDLAVLVRTNSEAVIVHHALDALAIPSVIGGGGSVFATAAAAHWLALLEALEQPAATTRARAAALTPFVGWDVPGLAAALDAELDALQATLHRWAAVLAGSGVAALTETVASEVGLVARLLAGARGERQLTDLRHVGELLHGEAMVAGRGARALTAWLRERMDDAEAATAAEERSRRLESDGAAVQILTIHRSKGLEYPIVYLPYLWLAFPDNDPLPLYHDPDRGDVRTVDVGGDRPDGFQPHRARAADERRGEDLRQAYVAFTRARHQVVAWWASGQEAKSSPLARLLLGREGDRSISSRPAIVPKDDDVVEARMREVAGRAPGRISVERVGQPRLTPWEAVVSAPRRLEVATFERPLDTLWRRSSYSAIVGSAHDAGSPVASEAEDPGVTDEAARTAEMGIGGGGRPRRGDAVEMGGRDSAPPVPSPMAGLPAGPAFGIVVHAVLEGVDFAAPALGAVLGQRIATVTGRPGGERGVVGGPGAPDPVALGVALRSVLETSLGPLAGGRSLRQVERADRLDELTFELPLVGGDHPRGRLALADIAGCLRRWLPADDPLVAYPDRLEDPAVDQVLRGYLTGSIDMVLRVPAGSGPTHLVVDYKTNWLGPPGEPLTTEPYRPAPLREAMVAAHYPLQAVLYSVAVHRYLRGRMAGYDPERHLGGVLYLFLRGMAGPATPTVDGTPCGVFAWDPPPGMTVELSDLLDDGSEAAR